MVPIGEKRWVIEHIGVFDADEIRRIRDFGLVLTSYTGRYILQWGPRLRRELGEAGAERVAPLRALSEAGVHVSLATDNVPPTMFHPIWHAVARRGEDGEVVGPGQSLGREAALAGASREGAYLTFEEDAKGTIEVGKLADVAVLSEDPLTCPEERLAEIVAELTIVGGEVVFERDGDAP